MRCCSSFSRPISRMALLGTPSSAASSLIFFSATIVPARQAVRPPVMRHCARPAPSPMRRCTLPALPPHRRSAASWQARARTRQQRLCHVILSRDCLDSHPISRGPGPGCRLWHCGGGVPVLRSRALKTTPYWPSPICASCSYCEAPHQAQNLRVQSPGAFFCDQALPVLCGNGHVRPARGYDAAARGVSRRPWKHIRIV